MNLNFRCNLTDLEIKDIERFMFSFTRVYLCPSILDMRG